MPYPTMTKEAVIHQINDMLASKSDAKAWTYFDLNFSTFTEEERVIIAIKLFEEGWHSVHENLASLFQHLRHPLATDILFKNAFRKELDPFDYKPLARKCVWALADIGTDQAKAYLEIMATCGDPIIEGFAQKRLAHWEKELPRKGRFTSL